VLAASAIIMAGGQSRRMKTNKALLPLNGRPLIQHIAAQLSGHFDQVLLSANEAETYAFLGLPVIPDHETGHGPLMGIISAVSASRHERNFVVACDIPRVDMDLAVRLVRAAEGADVVVPRGPGGHYEALFAVYCKSALPALKRILERGERQIIQAFPLCRVHELPLPSDNWLANLNTKADYEAFQRTNATDGNE
jgi:molybdenum cofactor guanylyltransferase